jgi:hypothetical protein
MQRTFHFIITHKHNPIEISLDRGPLKRNMPPLNHFLESILSEENLTEIFHDTHPQKPQRRIVSDFISQQQPQKNLGLNNNTRVSGPRINLQKWAEVPHIDSESCVLRKRHQEIQRR